jgi:hypothetical protein
MTDRQGGLGYMLGTQTRNPFRYLLTFRKNVRLFYF